MDRARPSHLAVDRIASWVVGGRYAPGQTLPVEAAIGAELAVSRTVVREALKTLSAKGMVVTGPRLGTRVRPRTEWNHFDPDVVHWRVDAGIDEAFVDDLVAFRRVIEPAAARLAAQAATPADVAGLREALAEMTRATEGKGSYLQADLDFHQRLLMATHNQFFAGMARVFTALLAVSFRLSVASLAGARSSLPAHKRVLDGIAARNGDAAAAAMQGLIDSAKEDLRERLGRPHRQGAVA